MSKVTRSQVVHEGLELLDEVGLDAFTTRRLAQRLGVEQPSLYHHFRNKGDLLVAMAEEAMTPHAAALLPSRGDNWREWFIENHRSFRATLLGRRDGARLHSGTFPSGNDLDRARYKLAFLVEAGIPVDAAAMGMLTASRFTVGSALEEQADNQQRSTFDGPPTGHSQAFEAGLELIVNGLALHDSVTGAGLRPVPSPLPRHQRGDPKF